MKDVSPLQDLPKEVISLTEDTPGNKVSLRGAYATNEYSVNNAMKSIFDFADIAKSIH